MNPIDYYHTLGNTNFANAEPGMPLKEHIAFKALWPLIWGGMGAMSDPKPLRGGLIGGTAGLIGGATSSLGNALTTPSDSNPFGPVDKGLLGMLGGAGAATGTEMALRQIFNDDDEEQGSHKNMKKAYERGFMKAAEQFGCTMVEAKVIFKYAAGLNNAGGSGYSQGEGSVASTPGQVQAPQPQQQQGPGPQSALSMFAGPRPPINPQQIAALMDPAKQQLLAQLLGQSGQMNRI